MAFTLNVSVVNLKLDNPDIWVGMPIVDRWKKFCDERIESMFPSIVL